MNKAETVDFVLIENQSRFPLAAKAELQQDGFIHIILRECDIQTCPDELCTRVMVRKDGKS